MNTPYNSYDFWRSEVAYIEDAATYKKYANFNNDEQCFIRYCEMQRDTANKYCFFHAAEQIQRVIDELKNGKL